MNNQDLNLTFKIKPYSNLEMVVLKTQTTHNPLHKLLTSQTINYSMLKLVTLNCAIPTQTYYNIAINYAQKNVSLTRNHSSKLVLKRLSNNQYLN